MMDYLPDIVFGRGWLLWWILIVPVVVFLPVLIRRTRQGAGIGWLRAVLLALLLVTLADPMLAYHGQNVTTIFAIDRSASIQPAASDAANTWVTNALGKAGLDNAAAIVTFGAQPTLNVAPVDPASGGIDSGWQQTPQRDTSDATDISSALTLARSLPVGESRRIVLLSDGAENQGSALEAADQAAAEGIPIDVVPLDGVDPADLRLVDLSGPQALWQGDELSVLATISVGAGGPVQIDLLIDGEVVSTQNVTLQPGTTSYTLSHPALSPGFHAVQVRVTGSSEIDRIPENDSAALALIVRDRPSVLMISPEGADPSQLTSALQAQGAEVKVISPRDAPSSPAQLTAYQSVILNNVPAWTLDEQQQAALVRRTQDGGGLIAIGGSASFGPGSYAGTTLETALPVTVKVTDGRQRPRVAVLIVMDKSGSMGYDPSSGGVSKLDLAKDGVLTAAKALTKGDQIGVIAFNDQPAWALPMTTLTGSGDQDRIDQAIAPLAPSGGTEMYPALRLAYDSLRNVDADVRHIILLSDGRSRSGTQASYDTLLTDLGKDRITLSAVALGTDADINLLQHLAVQGGGRYHFAQQPSDIPTITFQEAQSAGSQSVIRGSFTPIQQQPSTMLTGIDPASLPLVGGYDFTAGKPDAQVVLTSDRGDPLLVNWQVGLGRVATWTGDDGSDFARQWATWENYATFWGNVLRWTLPDPENQAITASALRDGADAVVTINTTSTEGASPDLSQQQVTITGPDKAETDMTLTAAGPGRYEVRLTGASAGAYALSIPATGSLLGFAVEPSPEWQPSPDGDGLLQSIAARTGGSVRSLDGDTYEGLYAAAPDAEGAPGTVRSIWFAPLLLALLLFIGDIAWRLGFDLWRPFRVIRDHRPRLIRRVRT